MKLVRVADPAPLATAIQGLGKQAIEFSPAAVVPREIEALEWYVAVGYAYSSGTLQPMDSELKGSEQAEMNADLSDLGRDRRDCCEMNLGMEVL